MDGEGCVLFGRNARLTKGTGNQLTTKEEGDGEGEEKRNSREEEDNSKLETERLIYFPRTTFVMESRVNAPFNSRLFALLTRLETSLL